MLLVSLKTLKDLNLEEGKGMDYLSKISQMAIECDFLEYGYVEIDNLKYHPEVRVMCEDNTCRNYGTSWACPPAVGTIEECRTRVAQYEKMMIFSRAYSLEDSFTLRV